MIFDMNLFKKYIFIINFKSFVRFFLFIKKCLGVITFVTFIFVTFRTVW